MIDIHDLEKRWLRYKIKSFIPHTVITLSIIIIAVVASFTLNSSEPMPTTPKAKNVKTAPVVHSKAVVQTPKQPKPKPVVKPTTVQSTSMKLKPSLGFMKEMQQTTLPYYTETIPQTVQTVQVAQAKKTKPIKEQEPSKVIEEETNRQLIIQKRDARHDINDVIKRFKASQNPALSLFIAKQYYDLGKYKKAYNYALITNKINSEIEDSWLVFAKSLVKLGEKKMAIKTLQKYIQNSDSQNAQILLEDIKSGKFQ